MRDPSRCRAERFTRGLFDSLHGRGEVRDRFEAFTEVIADLPRRQTRVLTWPLHTVFGFIALPNEHIFLKPRVTQAAAQRYGFDFAYRSRPDWETYASLLAFAEQVRADQRDLKPRDFIDLQGFIWVVGSDEYDRDLPPCGLNRHLGASAPPSKAAGARHLRRRRS